ncbi:MAG TPA: diadenylate cyclase CdaA [Clostridiales bacterium]|nr:diadenylate cyclase CdaA [Clostridiales bacterium]
MARLLDYIAELWDKIVIIILSFRLPDLLDIILVAFILYNALKFIRETRAFQLAKGIILLGGVYLLISLLNMQASEYIFGRLFSDFIIVLIILFQPEIRHAVESVGASKFSGLKLLGGIRNEQALKDEKLKSSIITVCKACNEMSSQKIGALIVFENENMLGEIIKSRTLVDAQISHELLCNIFFPMSPLHDGAAILREGRVHAAACILPLTQNISLAQQMGTRHRAAIGLAEQSDAAVVVVSEESGSISMAYKNRLERDLTESELFDKLTAALLSKEPVTQSAGGRLKERLRRRAK